LPDTVESNSVVMQSPSSCEPSNVWRIPERGRIPEIGNAHIAVDATLFWLEQQRGEPAWRRAPADR
jgi:hypothetical protein